MTEPSKLDRIRKLLVQAEDPAATEAEALAFNAKAAELMAAYGIERAMLAVTDPGTDRVADRVIQIPAPYALDKADLLMHTAEALRCKTIKRRRWVGNTRCYEVHLFGMTSDLERAEVLWTSLLVQVAHGLVATLPPAWESPAAYRRAWILGFRRAVVGRLILAEERAERDARHTGRAGVALVLADRSALVRSRVDQAYPNVRSARRRELAGSGEDAGYRAGQRADLGGTRLDGSGRREVTR